MAIAVMGETDYNPRATDENKDDVAF